MEYQDSMEFYAIHRLPLNMEYHGLRVSWDPMELLEFQGFYRISWRTIEVHEVHGILGIP